jgi:hypothetical protein
MQSYTPMIQKLLQKSKKKMIKTRITHSRATEIIYLNGQQNGKSILTSINAKSCIYVMIICEINIH